MNAAKVLPKALVFAIHRKNYFAAGGKPAETKDDGVANAIKVIERDGTLVIPGFWHREQALHLGGLLEREAHAARTEKKNLRFHWMQESETLRVVEPEKLSEKVSEFFDSAFIKSVARGVTCEKIVSWQRMFETRSSKPLLGSSDGWHVDEAFYFKFKAFLYLTDVTEETAPYMYLKGSHRRAPWRRQMERQILTHDLYGPDSVDGLRGNFLDFRQIKYLKKRFGYSEMVCTGPAGSLVLTTTTGLHKATTPISGGRRMLGHYFELPRASIWPKTFKNG
jgi:hypothetical protein